MTSLVNVKVVYKLFIIYILCVMLPIVCLNLLFYYTMTKFLTDQKIERTELSMNRIIGGLESTVNNILTLSNDLSTDEELAIFLTHRFASPMEFIYKYQTYYQPRILRILALNPVISNIVIAIDNPTFQPMGFQSPLNQQVLEDWNINLPITNPGFRQITFTDNIKFSQFETIPKQITIINTMQNYREKSQRLLRIDLFMRPIEKIVAAEQLDGYLSLEENKERQYNFTNQVEEEIYNSDYITYTYPVFKEILEVPWQLIYRFSKVNFNEIYSSMGIYVLTIGLLSLLITALMMYMVSTSITGRLHALAQTMENYSGEVKRLEYILPGSDEIGHLIHGYNRLSERIQELIDDEFKHHIKEQELEISRKQAELLSLHSQINPHMLFNTLEVIRMRSVIHKNKEIAEIIKALSSLFRKQLIWNTDYSTVADEIESLKNFLFIQHYTFGDRLTSKIEVADDLLDCALMRMSLQPFVENACIHGLDKKKGEVYLKVTINELAGRINVKITDNGIGISPQVMNNIHYTLQCQSTNNQSIGMYNVVHRLRLLYGNTLNFSIENRSEGGCLVSFSFPKESDKVKQ